MDLNKRGGIAGIVLSMAAGGLALAGCTDSDPTDAADSTDATDAQTFTPEATDYEIWSVDQGTHKIYIHDSDHEHVDTLDLGEYGVRTPHMIDFTSDYAYAFTANLHSGDVAVIRTEDRKVLNILKTGPHTHMAGVSPNDEQVLVDVIGKPDVHRDGRLVEIEMDLDRELFTTARKLRLENDSLLHARSDDFNDFAAICHEYVKDGDEAYITLGPGLDDAGVLVFDMNEFAVDHAWGPDELAANCGTMPTADGQYMVLNGGGPETGEWFVVDVNSREVIHQAESRGKDAHGVWLTPDGTEMWMVNRVTDNAIIIDPETWEIIDEMDYVGDTPDIMGMSPDGQYAYISLRGPNPVSAAHVAVGTTSGFSVIDIPNREKVDLIQPDGENPDSDFHGIGVRYIHDDD